MRVGYGRGVVRGKVIAVLVAVACAPSCDADDGAQAPTDSSGVATSGPGSSPLPGATVASTAPTSVEIVSTTSEAPESTVTPETTASTTTTTTTTTTIAEVEPLVRPIIDPAICDPTSAWETDGGRVIDDLTLFARPSGLPVPIQVIGNPVGGEAKPFALIQRFYDRPEDSVTARPDVVDIDGRSVVVEVYPNGNGNASWDLDDGSTAYLRSRGLDRGEITRVVAALTPRSADADVPGFDFDRSAELGSGLQLVAEQMNTAVRFGPGAGAECVVPGSGYSFRVSTYSGGDAVFRFGSAIDRPAPVAVGVVGDRVVMIEGYIGENAPAPPGVDDVVNTDEATWLDLRSRPSFLDGDFGSRLIGNGWTVVVRLDPVDSDDAVRAQYVTLRLAPGREPERLDVDLADLDLPEGNPLTIKISIANGTPATGPAERGTTLGVELGAERLSGEFPVTISLATAAGEPTHTSEEIRLRPVP